MQDRFKFRVWLKDANKMYNVHSLHIGTNKAIISSRHGNVSIYINKNSILMQSTGLKDKNGKMIYEGDIIVIPNQYPFYDYKNKEDMKQDLNETLGKVKDESILNYVGVVEYIYNSWQYVYHCVNPKKADISERINYLLNEYGIKENENSYFKVIGNIYENKELLESKEK